MRCAGLALLGLLSLWPLNGQSDWSDEQKKAFLLKAAIASTRGAPDGIAGTVRATLTDGGVTHDASIAVIDVTPLTPSLASPPEPGFSDRCIYNVAAYELGRMLKLNNIPVSVARSFHGKNAVFTWWVDGTMMTEKERRRKKTEPPDADEWNHQMLILRVFDQLIYNMDRNLGNVVIDEKWKIWMIDHTRAFRLWKQIKTKENLVAIDKTLLQRMRELDAATLKERLSDYLSPSQIDALAKRAQLIVQYFDDQVKKQGSPKVLFTCLPTS